MSLKAYIRKMPKIELHVHLEGAVQPTTLLKLAQKNQIKLPATTLEEIGQWYQFRDFPHFIQIYLAISSCIRTPDDIELIAREFLENQAAQNVVYTEITYTPYTHFLQKKLPFAEQLAALNRARHWAESTHGITMRYIMDISRTVSPEEGMVTAEWAVSGMNQGVIALGLGGPEVNNPPEKHKAAFDLTRAAGLPGIPHAGETEGAASIAGSIHALEAVRIEHGVRCLEDEMLVDLLAARQIPLDVCPSSNICLGVFGEMGAHSLPRLLDAGLKVTINSDDPPMFNTTLTDEYLRISEALGFGINTLEQLAINALESTMLKGDELLQLRQRYLRELASARTGTKTDLSQTLLRTLSEDKQSEQGWLQLAESASNLTERQYALQRAMYLNPQGAARAQLTELRRGDTNN